MFNHNLLINKIMESVLVLPRESLICSICDDLLESPYECKACNNLFCADCIKLYLDTKDKYRRLYFCPMCRNKKNNFSENTKINDLLEDFKRSGKKLCIKCNSVFPQQTFKTHINKCWYKCTICHQLFSNEKKFLEHYSKNENDELNDILNKFNRKTNLNKINKKAIEEKKNNEEENEKIKRELFENNLPKNGNSHEENDLVIVNKNGHNSKYNLYFCGKENGINCKCCSSKICCPQGEICQNCMKKNLKYHNLKGYYLINKKGKACKYNHGNFHCYSKYFEIKKDKGGNYFKEEKTCCENNTCEACQNITKLMNYYLPANIIKKLVERDSQNSNSILKNNNKLSYINL